MPKIVVLALVASLVFTLLSIWRPPTGQLSSPGAQKQQGTTRQNLPNQVTVQQKPHPDRLGEPALAPVKSAWPPKGRVLQLYLQPQGELRPLPRQARIGLARISAADRRTYEQWQLRKRGWQGAGPSCLDDLANVVQWISTPVRVSPQGIGQVGPLQLAPARFYYIMALGSQQSYYLGRYRPEQTDVQAGKPTTSRLYPTRATGLRLRLVNYPCGQNHYWVRLCRRPGKTSQQPLPVFQDLLAWWAPQLAAAYHQEQPLLIKPGHPLLLRPLYPDPEIRLIPIGPDQRPGSPVDIALQAGTIMDVDLDVGTLSSQPLALRGTLRLQQAPLAGAVVYLLDSGVPGSHCITDAQGHFYFPAISSQQPTQFMVVCKKNRRPRPVTKLKHYFTFLPQEKHRQSGMAHVSWQLKSYHWLVLRLTAADQRAYQLLCQRPYPIYLLQKYSAQHHRWCDCASDHFLTDANGIAASLDHPGRYRLALALSPLYVITSNAVLITPEATPANYTYLDTPPNEPQEYVLSLRRGSVPLSAGSTVMIMGPHRSLPPLAKCTNALGQLSLGPVNVSDIYITVESCEKRIRCATLKNTTIVLNLQK